MCTSGTITAFLFLSFIFLLNLLFFLEILLFYLGVYFCVSWDGGNHAFFFLVYSCVSWFRRFWGVLGIGSICFCYMVVVI